jgi:hypothetical protein
VSPVRFELGFYIPEDDILHSHRRENFESYIQISNLTDGTSFMARKDGGSSTLLAVQRKMHGTATSLCAAVGVATPRSD